MSATKRKAVTIVYVLAEEYCFSENGEIGSVLGVFTSEQAAKDARAEYVEEAKADGKVVSGEGDDDGNWDRDYVITEHQLQD